MVIVIVTSINLFAVNAAHYIIYITTTILLPIKQPYTYIASLLSFKG